MGRTFEVVRSLYHGEEDDNGNVITAPRYYAAGDLVELNDTDAARNLANGSVRERGAKGDDAGGAVFLGTTGDRDDADGTTEASGRPPTVMTGKEDHKLTQTRAALGNEFDEASGEPMGPHVKVAEVEDNVAKGPDGKAITQAKHMARRPQR